MKRKYILSVLSLVFVAATSSAQKLSFTVFGGYTFRDKVSFAEGFGYIEDNAHYGGSVEFFPHKLTSIEFLYRRMDTDAPLYSVLDSQVNPLTQQAALNYLLIGGNRYIPFANDASFYGGLSLGMCILSDKYDHTITRGAGEARLGVIIKATEHIAVKVQSQLSAVVDGVGTTYYFGSSGSGYSVSGTSSILQFGFTGGLTIIL